MKNAFLTAVFCLTPLFAVAFDPEVQTEVEFILSEAKHISNVQDRAIFISEKLLDRKFAWGPCGEGSFGAYESKPLTTFKKFDCTTYVEPVLAMTLVAADSQTPFEDFKKYFLGIKYCDANDVCYVNRNHFTSTNWVPNATSEKKKFLKDITKELFAKAKLRTKTLNVGKWYAGKIKKLKASDDENKDAKIAELEKESKNKKGTKASLYYIPLADLLKEEVQTKLKAQKIVLFNMVKAEHTKVKDIPVIIGHQGYILFDKGKLVVRHAASGKTTLDVDFVEYVKTRQKDTTWPTLGFHIMSIVQPE